MIETDFMYPCSARFNTMSYYCIPKPYTTQCYRAWWVPKMWELDPFVVPLPFDQDTWLHGRGKGKKIRLGYFLTDNWCVFVNY
jgi:hypothetical protein